MSELEKPLRYFDVPKTCSLKAVSLLEYLSEQFNEIEAENVQY